MRSFYLESAYNAVFYSCNQPMKCRGIMQTKREQELIPACDWQPWQWQAPEGFWLRGVHTVPRGLPVLHFIHGNSYCGRIYEPMWQFLYPNFDIFLLDAQGHGDSDLGGQFVGWKRSAELA